MRRNILRVVSRLASGKPLAPAEKTGVSSGARLQGYRSRFDPEYTPETQLGKNGKHFHPEFSASYGLHHSNPPPEHFGLEKADFIITDNMVAKSNTIQGKPLPPMDPEKHLIYRGAHADIWLSYMYFGRIFEVKKFAQREVASNIRAQIVAAVYNTFQVEELKDFETAQHRTFGVYEIDIVKRLPELLDRLALEVIVPQSQLRPVVEQLVRESFHNGVVGEVSRLTVGQLVDRYCNFILALQERFEAEAARLPNGLTEDEACELEKLGAQKAESKVVQIRDPQNDNFINRLMSCLH